jgi:putative molybdopterin biosynthesis protein
MQPEYMTTAEVCDYLRLKERTIYDLVARKAIPCSRATGKLIFPRRLIDRWIEANLDTGDRHRAEPPAIVGGSSDPLLEWALRESGSGLATLFEGSEAGLRRLSANGVTAAGLHLFFPEEQAYNAPALRTLAAHTDLVLVQWAWREQGIVVPRGNPLGLESLGDVARTGARVILRQPGSGTRTLFQHLAAEAGIPLASVRVLDKPALTEADVAAAVADGEAECGIAIGAAARRFGLGFVPLGRERFDLVMRRRDHFEPPIQALLAFTRTEPFRARAAALGCYDVSGAGRIEFNA